MDAVTSVGGAATPLPREEVRLAMGWNGGVSLAVWMGGVAVELDCARRAHLAPEWLEINGATLPELPDRSVYHALCTAFDRELVLDIMAGASAGGLNSALLAAAMSAQRRLHPTFLRSKWIAIGDMSKLLQPTNRSQPTSIMQGDLFADSVRTAFDELMTVQPEDDWCALPTNQDVPSALPLLDIQATNVMGKQRGFVDTWGRELFAREYRAPFCFREPEDFTAATLAAAARASASFPAAFEPYSMIGDSLRLTGLSNDPEAAWNKQVAERPRPEQRFAIDGGLLENAPIRQAIELIPARPASGPVSRFVVYVNANPSSDVIDPSSPKEKPNLREVLSYVVNLPRIGRDVDQIDAITQARRRAEKNSDTLQALLEIPLDELRTTAGALFHAYRTRRAYSAFDDILGAGKPVRVEVVDALMDATHDGALLPWFPASFKAPESAPQWNWGFKTAERILYLQLDLLSKALEASYSLNGEAGAVAHLVYHGRGPIDEAIGELDAAYKDFLAAPGLIPCVAALRDTVDDPDRARTLIDVLAAIYTGFQIDRIWAPLHAATEAFYKTAGRLNTIGAFPRYRSLFAIADDETPPDDLTPDGFRCFVEYGLAIEVVRRAFLDDAEVDAAQRFAFAQLAPNSPGRIFTDTPLRSTGPADGTLKLTGIRLGHFAGFYRSSWRANDFMWGRLDAATRIAEILVDGNWQRRLPPGSTPWTTLAEAVVPLGESVTASDLRDLVLETIEDAKTPAKDVDHAIGTYVLASDPPADAPGLRAYVAELLRLDLTAADPRQRGYVSRVILGRAAQYETLRAELGVLCQQVVEDRRAGASSAPLKWDLGEDKQLMPVIKDLRSYSGDRALPCRLGRDSDDELTSTLALRTMAHASLVSLAALPGLGAPLRAVTWPFRLPFLSVAGTASKSLLANLAIVASFGAATWYLATRIISADNHRIATGDERVYLDAVTSPPVIAMLVAGLLILGVLVVPAARAVKSSHRVWNIFCGALLLATAGVIPLVFGWRRDGLAVTLTGTGGFKPNPALIAIAFFVLGVGTAGARHLPYLGLLSKLRDATTWTISALGLVTAPIFLGWSAPHLVHALNDGGWRSWHTLAALAAFASMPVLIVYAFRVSWAHYAVTAPQRLKQSAPVRWTRRAFRFLTRRTPLEQPH